MFPIDKTRKMLVFYRKMIPEKPVWVFSAKVTALRGSRFKKQITGKGLSDSALQKIENQGWVPSDKTIKILAEFLAPNDEKVFNELIGLAAKQRIAAKGVRQQRRHSTSELPGTIHLDLGTTFLNAFEPITENAQTRIIIMGIGMTRVSLHGLSHLATIRKDVSIDFLMLNPKSIDGDSQLGAMIAQFTRMLDFVRESKRAAERIRRFCEERNEGSAPRTQFRVYDAIPTMSMVMTDPQQSSGRADFEPFLYRIGEVRPRLRLLNEGSGKRFFALLENMFTDIWEAAERIV